MKLARVDSWSRELEAKGSILLLTDHIMEPYDDAIGGNETVGRESAPTLDLDELIGETLDGRYLLERKLGRGGFGAVYLASDNKAASRKVVVKVMRVEEAQNEWSRKRFKQEVEALSRIDHPSVVGLFDCGETTSGRPYIVMQYIDGSSLRSLLTPEGMPFARVARIIRQIGDALTAAHEAGILHRDLKPENIMVKIDNDDEEHVKVIDFGVAKVKNSIINLSTAQGTTVGTIAYLSPEQLSDQPVTPESDVYALAVIAYEMLTGRRPTNPDSAFSLLELQRAGIKVKPLELRPALTETASDIVLKALSFNPQDRYQRACEFGDLLAEALLSPEELTQSNRQHDSSRDAGLQTAHVLFMDIIGYSKLLIDEQTQQLQKLQEIVLETNECRRAHAAGELIRLPTGDGMALVFFQDPEAPVRCAVEIGRILNGNPVIELRMGIHSGLVYRMADVNTNMNVAGGGINVAQRVMDCGDRGHILLSKRVADDLGQLARWSAFIEDLGEAEVKHGARLHLFNLRGADFGNPAHPARFQPTSSMRVYRKRSVLVAAIVIVGLIVGGLWYLSKVNSTSTPIEPVSGNEPIGPERSFIYWLNVQKTLNGRAIGEPFQSAGDNVFGNGWRFQFYLKPTQPGALYLLSVGPGKESAEQYNILFPLPDSGKQISTLSADQIMQSEWLRFTEKTGAEKIWIIWSITPLPDLDSIFAQAAQPTNAGEITDAEQLKKIHEYLKLYDNAKVEVVSDKSQKITSIKGHGEVIVSRLTLSHEAY